MPSHVLPFHSLNFCIRFPKRNLSRLGTTSSTFLLSDSGAAELAVTVPDSITDWRAMTFCTSESHGLGISEAASLRSFKPFFVEPTLPYSVFRGESFPLKVKVFSYLKQCMAVSGSLQASLEQRKVWKLLYC